MALNQNQFKQIPVQGEVDLQFHGSVISAQVDAAQATPLVAGQFVKLATTAGGVPKVVACAANTDVPFACVTRNLKNQNFAAGDALEIGMFGTVMFMTAGGAIARGGSIEQVYTTQKVIANAGTNPVLGFAIDKAVADGDVIRVWVSSPFGTVVPALATSVKTINVTATLAEINAGKVLIPAVAGQRITVTDYVARVTGNFATGTAVIIESNNVTPVLVSTLAEAGLTDASVKLPASSNTTLGAGFAAALGLGDGLQVVNSGSAQTGGTNINFTITYTQA